VWTRSETRNNGSEGIKELYVQVHGDLTIVHTCMEVSIAEVRFASKMEEMMARKVSNIEARIRISILIYKTGTERLRSPVLPARHPLWVCGIGCRNSREACSYNLR